MNHLMIDLETMGNKPNAPVVSIGAVFFEPSTGELGKEFYRVVSLKSSMDGGAVPDPETIIWWMQQNEEARKAICDKENSIALWFMLCEFSHSFIRNNADPKKIQVWAMVRRLTMSSCEQAMTVRIFPALGISPMIAM